MRWCTPLAAVIAALCAASCEVGPPAGGMVSISDFAIDVYEYPNQRRALPKHNVSFPEALAACAERGKRLCTIWEWTQACAGPSGRRFPYGDAYDDRRCHTAVAIQGHTSTGVAAGMARSGSYADCVSEEGVYDLSGNLEEWVDGFHHGQRGILMGGAWYTHDEYTDCTGLYSQSPMYRMRPQEKVFSAGFRCCTGPPVTEEDLRAWAEERRAAEIAATRAVAPDPDGMIDLGAFEIDRYEYPNRAGAPPLVHVTWPEARDLCREVGKRLCTADEWETACRSASGGDYPYADRYRAGVCNTGGDGPAPAGSFPACVSGSGAMDMSGNVWEWTAERIDLGEGFGADHDRRVVRGGGWYDYDAGAGCAYAQGYFAADPTFGYREVGLRCCRDSGAPAYAQAPPRAPIPGLRELGEARGAVSFVVDEEGGVETSAGIIPDGSAVSTETLEAGSEAATAAAEAPTPPAGGCPEDMVRAGEACIDRFEYPNQPGVVPQANIGAVAAAELCAARGRRLCSAREWGEACRGPERTRWPYGDEYDREACNYGFTGGLGGVEAAGSHPRCVSGYGAFDLSGNLWEWVSDLDAEGKAQIYGGYWNLGATYGKCDTVASAAQGFSHMSVGFRCCADPS